MEIILCGGSAEYMLGDILKFSFSSFDLDSNEIFLHSLPLLKTDIQVISVSLRPWGKSQLKNDLSSLNSCTC